MKYEINVFTRDLARGRDTAPVIIEQEREIGMDREQFKTLFFHMCLCYGDAGGALSNETYATIYVDGVYTRALRLRTRCPRSRRRSRFITWRPWTAGGTPPAAGVKSGPVSGPTNRGGLK